MDKQSKKIDKLTHKLINEAGLEKPSLDFLSNVMDQIEVQKVNQPIVYQPLITKKSWIFLFAITMAILVLLVAFPVFSETSMLSQYSLPEQYQFNFTLPEIKLSKTAVYGIGFLSLFLLQIPFLKRQLNNH